jgi:hypothetical protein
VTVRKREHRLRLRQLLKVKARLAHRPRFDGEGGVLDHRSQTVPARPTRRLAPGATHR